MSSTNSLLAENNKTLIAVFDLKNLLFRLKEERPDICVRYRLLGEMWVVNPMRILAVTEKGAIFRDESTSKIVNVASLSLVMQFEIDAPFLGFQPHYHYHVQSLAD
jgi:hypothetical protein